MACPNGLQRLRRGPSCLEGDEVLTLLKRVFGPESLCNSFTSLLSSGPAWSAVYFTPSLLQGKQLRSFSLACPFIKKSFLDFCPSTTLPKALEYRPAADLFRNLPQSCSTSESLGSQPSPFLWSFPPQWSPAYTGLTPPLLSTHPTCRWIRPGWARWNGPCSPSLHETCFWSRLTVKH